MRQKRKLQFSAPYKAAPKRYYYRIDAFKGVDFRHSPLDVAINRSPDAVNMIRDDVGQIRKRYGYSHNDISSLPNSGILGGYSFHGDHFLHAKTGLYLVENGQATLIGTLLDSDHTQGWNLGEYMYFVDGKAYRRLRWDNDQYVLQAMSTKRVYESSDPIPPYIPKIIISRFPTGGGQAHEPYNLINRMVRNSFIVNSDHASATVFQLTDPVVSNTPDESGFSWPVTAQILQSDGTWTTLTEGSGFSVNRSAGVVTFATAPGVSPVAGEDNVIIEFGRRDAEFNDERDKIDHCTIGTLYGVNGAADRLFLSGNPDYKGYDWYSAQNDPTYFPDTNYSKLGIDEAPIVGYSIIADRLVAHKSGAELDKNVVIRRGVLADVYGDGGEQAAFPIANVMQGASAISDKTHRFLQTEPLFLTADGVYAIAAQDVTGDRYSQIRSAYINPKLKQEDLSEAFAIIYNDFYLLFCGDKIYALDGLQKAYERDEPFSAFQYESYYLDLNLHDTVTSAWIWDGTLYFGTQGGNVYFFNSDASEAESYEDHPVVNGTVTDQAIEAHWDTPFLTGKVIYNRKIFRYIGVTMKPFYVNTLTVYGMVDGLWRECFKDNASATYFDFNHVDFSKLSFKTDTSPITAHHKIFVGVVDKTMFRLENKEHNEPFGVYALTTEYTETGKIAN